MRATAHPKPPRAKSFSEFKPPPKNSPAQIDVQVVGRDRATNLRVAHELRQRLADIPGIADAHLQQELDAPAFMVNIDRSRALQLDLNAETIATDVNTSLSSSEQVATNFWTDPASAAKDSGPYGGVPQLSTPEHFKWRDRGLLKVGHCADLAIFDPDDFRDQATYAEPHHYPSGAHTRNLRTFAGIPPNAPASG